MVRGTPYLPCAVFNNPWLTFDVAGRPRNACLVKANRARRIERITRTNRRARELIPDCHEEEEEGM